MNWIRNNLQLGARISTVETFWAHHKNGGLVIPQNGLAS